ncbi:hypothetical protein [Vibrio sp. OPT18]|uniref:hypothetical protein n=1 Tax=Vibrio sp. OPT18 TaxID=2778641 RepID=UPI001882FC99|nr:hypothetical protein [Vibrio sp. OPT18]MBE8578453.1 hypothetical protein [Vibrio sp. OPT18]
MFGFFKRSKRQRDFGSEMAITGLENISDAIDKNSIELEPGRMFDDVYSHFDKPDGVPRVTYVMFSPSIKNEVIARCAIILERSIDGVGVWSIDWAVKDSYRGQGFGTAIATKASLEFTNGMKPQIQNGFYFEAIVSKNNLASNQIASKLLGNVKTITNPETKEIVNNYMTKL